MFSEFNLLWGSAVVAFCQTKLSLEKYQLHFFCLILYHIIIYAEWKEMILIHHFFSLEIVVAVGSAINAYGFKTKRGLGIIIPLIKLIHISSVLIPIIGELFLAGVGDTYNAKIE